MQLSIMLTTHRTGLNTVARVAHACSFAGPEIEVVVRDNSGDPQKRDLLDRMRQDYCNIVLAEPCDGLTNHVEALRLTKGDFVFVVADDDFCLDQGIAGLPRLLSQIGDDPAYCGVTGGYLLESKQGSSVFDYQHVDADDLVTRVAGYLSTSSFNILQYAPLRRSVIVAMYELMGTLPFFFSFHDQVQSLFLLMHGKFARLGRLLYIYDVGPWERGDSAQKRDLQNYVDAGLDPAVNLLHWFLCGFEGAVLARNSELFPNYPLAQRQSVADHWFSSMFLRFRAQERMAFGSAHEIKARQICAKLQSMTGGLGFDGILEAICDVMALSSKDAAQRYFDYWSAAIHRRSRLNPLTSPVERKMAG